MPLAWPFFVVSAMDQSNSRKLTGASLVMGTREANMEAYDSLPVVLRALAREAPVDYDCVEIANALRRYPVGYVECRLLEQNARLAAATRQEYARLADEAARAAGARFRPVLRDSSRAPTPVTHRPDLA